jgi:hypothetical protein
MYGKEPTMQSSLAECRRLNAVEANGGYEWPVVAQLLKFDGYGRMSWCNCYQNVTAMGIYGLCIMFNDIYYDKMSDDG